MAEKSILWASPTSGDGAANYTQDETTRLFRHLFGDDANRGVLYGVEDELAVSGSASPMSIAKGSALVYGFFYWNDAAKSMPVTTPSATTGKRFVLRADYTAKTVRAVEISSPDGNPAIPALTQTPGVIYEKPLAQFQITSGGVIQNLVDERDYIHAATKIETGMIDDLAVTNAKLATDAVTNAKVANDAIGTTEIVNGAVSTAKLANNGVDNTKLRDSVALSVIGRSSNVDGDPADIAAATDAHVLRRSGSAVGFGQIALGAIPDELITPAKIQNRTRYLFIPVDGTTMGLYGVELGDGLLRSARGHFFVPEDFVSGMTVEAVVHANATGNAYLYSSATYGATGQATNTHSNVNALSTVALTSTLYAKVKSLTLSSIAAGDFVDLYFEREATDPSDALSGTVYCHGFLVTYTADS